MYLISVSWCCIMQRCLPTFICAIYISSMANQRGYNWISPSRCSNHQRSPLWLPNENCWSISWRVWTEYKIFKYCFCPILFFCFFPLYFDDLCYNISYNSLYSLRLLLMCWLKETEKSAHSITNTSNIVLQFYQQAFHK